MDLSFDITTLVNRKMFPEGVHLHRAEIVRNVPVVDTATNAVQHMSVLVVQVVQGGAVQNVYLGMPSLGPTTIFGEVTMGIALRIHPNVAGHCFYNSEQGVYEVAIKRSDIATLKAKVRNGGETGGNEENPLNEIAIMESMQRFAREQGVDYQQLFPHNMSLDLTASDGHSLFIILPRMKNCMDLFMYCFENMETKTARHQLAFASRMQEVKMIMRAVLRAVYGLHAQNIAHRDLSLENVLISVTCGASLHIEDVKVIDFGMAVYHPPALAQLGDNDEEAKKSSSSSSSSANSSGASSPVVGLSSTSSHAFVSFDAEPAFDFDEDFSQSSAAAAPSASSSSPASSMSASKISRMSTDDDEDTAETNNDVHQKKAKQQLSTYSKPFYGKRAYIPPECFYHREATHFDPRCSDVWACGIMLYALAFNEMLFSMAHHAVDTQRFIDVYNDPVDGLRHLFYRILPRPVVVAEPLLLELLQGMLRIDPTERLTIEQVLQHPWFQSM